MAKLQFKPVCGSVSEIFSMNRMVRVPMVPYSTYNPGTGAEGTLPTTLVLYPQPWYQCWRSSTHNPSTLPTTLVPVPVPMGLYP